MKQKRSFFGVLAILVVIGGIWSFLWLTTPHVQTLDQRVQNVGLQLKCPICQGETVADSPSLLAQQMRGVIRQQLQAGKSESDVIQFFAARYGEQIVLSPPWQGFSLLAWLIPIVLLLGGAVLLFFTLRSWHTSATGDHKGIRAAPFPSTPSSPLRVFQETASSVEPISRDESELEGYRKQLEEELAADDPLFRRYGMEGR